MRHLRRLRSPGLGFAFGALAATAVLLAGCSDDENAGLENPPVVANIDCSHCHGDVVSRWSASRHADTQLDVADELAAERADETPDEVLHGDDPENCIACHGALAVTVNGSMTETDAMSYFFTTEGGKFTGNTSAIKTDEWPHVTCMTCHDVPEDDPVASPTLALFDSRTSEYTPVAGASELCGNCHGSLRFAETDHLTYDAWATSRHSVTQADVASELAEERAGETSTEVVFGADPENCIACHSPTSVLVNNGMAEDQALDYFFTTAGGKFTSSTSAAHADQWQDVSCTACHDQHDPDVPAYFNSMTWEYEWMASTTELCGQCHGSLRFPDTDHLSYDILTGTGGMGVPDGQTMPGVVCTDCHMYASDVDGSNSSMFHGHSWSVIVQEDGAEAAVACVQCHTGMSEATATSTIAGFQSSFATLDSTAQANVGAAEQALQGISDATLEAWLAEAQHNLEYAEGDESGGFHNHNYVMDLLDDANTKALDIIAALGGKPRNHLRG